MSEEKNNLISECCGYRAMKDSSAENGFSCNKCGKSCDIKEVGKQEKKETVGIDVCECGNKKLTIVFENDIKKQFECKECGRGYILDKRDSQLYYLPEDFGDNFEIAGLKKVDKLKEDRVEKIKNGCAKNGGAREGAGRKAGIPNESTKEKREALKEFKKRVRKNVNRLFNKQMSLADGVQMLFKRVDVGKGKDKKRITVLVESESEIKDYIDGLFDDMQEDNGEETYYFITTKAPDNRAIDSLLDRTFGKAQQNVHNTGDSLVSVNVGQTKYATIIKRENNDIDRGTVDDNDTSEQEQTD